MDMFLDCEMVGPKVFSKKGRGVRGILVHFRGRLPEQRDVPSSERQSADDYAF